MQIYFKRIKIIIHGYTKSDTDTTLPVPTGRHIKIQLQLSCSKIENTKLG